MIQDETILVLAYNQWSCWRSPNELAVRLSRENLVVFVEVFPRYELLGHENGRGAYCRSFFEQKPRWISNTLIVLTPPPMLPLYVSLLSRIFHRQIARASIRMSKLFQAWQLDRQLRSLGIQPTILFFFEPFDLLLAGEFGERLACYRTYDEIIHFFSNQGISDAIEGIERQNIDRADLVFCSSRAQYEKRKGKHPNVYLIANAADFKRFNQALAEVDEKPESLCELRAPLIGYIGTIDYRVDFGLLIQLATCRPEWNLVFVGPTQDYCQDQVERLLFFPNVRFLGRKPASDVPKYLRWFNVAIIPFLVTPSTSTMYPYKLHEYLAMGKPVVSTDLVEMRAFSDVICLASTPDEFISMVDVEIGTDSEEKRGRRIETALENSWEERMAEMSRLIEGALAVKR